MGVMTAARFMTIILYRTEFTHKTQVPAIPHTHTHTHTSPRKSGEI